MRSSSESSSWLWNGSVLSSCVILWLVRLKMEMVKHLIYLDLHFLLKPVVNKMTQILKLKILNSLIWNICERKIEENNGNYFRPGRKSVSEIARPRLLSVLDPKRYSLSTNIGEQQILVNNQYWQTTNIDKQQLYVNNKYWWTTNINEQLILVQISVLGSKRHSLSTKISVNKYWLCTKNANTSFVLIKICYLTWI